VRENNESNIQWRTGLIILVLDLVMLSFLYWNVISVQGEMIKQAETTYMCEQVHVMEAILRDLGKECQSLNKSIASYPEVEKSMIKAKHQDLKKLSLPDYSSWQSRYSLTNLQLISPQGLILGSAKKAIEEKEDVSYRRLILASLRDKGNLVAFESDHAGFNLVSTVALFTADKFIGLSELDMSLEQALERKLAKKVNGHYAIFQLDGIHSSLTWEDKASRMVLNTSDIKKIHQGEAYYRPTPDKKTMLLVVPLKDIDGVSIGYIQGEISRQAFQDARTNNLLFLLITTLLILIASLFMVSRERFDFPQSKHKTVTDSGKISRVCINVQPAQQDNHEDEKR